MEAIAASAIAVLGTLLGSGLTLRYQQRATDRTQAFTLAENLRKERLEAYAAYAGALVNYRRSLIHRYRCEREDDPDEDPQTAKLRSYEARSSAQEAMFRLQMLTADDVLSQASDQALSEVGHIHKAETLAQFDARRESTRRTVAELVAASKRDLQRSVSEHTAVV